jgi:cell division protein FtsZ
MAFSLESGPDNVVTIKVVGVGGAGNNVVNRMVEMGIQVVEIIACDTDKPPCNSKADVEIQIGKSHPGQGAGANPDVGKKAAEESRNKIAKALETPIWCSSPAGWAAAPAPGASPIIAEIARETGILTDGVVTKPFSFVRESAAWSGRYRHQRASGQGGLPAIIPNDR